MSFLSRGIRYLDASATLEGPVPLLDDEGISELLRTARRIAVVGASSHPWRASNSVMGYLLGHGYECIPVTPTRDEVLGLPCHDTLEEAAEATGGPFDIVDVFRRPEYVPDLARSAVALGCGALWLQLGVISWEAASIAHEGGVDTVMDRCSAVEHRRLR